MAWRAWAALRIAVATGIMPAGARGGTSCTDGSPRTAAGPPICSSALSPVSSPVVGFLPDTLCHDSTWLGAEVGLVEVLHTWTRDLRWHPHVHQIVTAGGWDAEAQRWIPARRHGPASATSAARGPRPNMDPPANRGRPRVARPDAGPRRVRRPAAGRRVDPRPPRPAGCVMKPRLVFAADPCPTCGALTREPEPGELDGWAKPCAGSSARTSTAGT